MAEHELIIFGFFVLFGAFDKLEVACRSFLDATEEVKRVASTRSIELWLQVFELGQHDLLLLSQVVKRDAEGARLLGKEVRIVLNC